MRYAMKETPQEKIGKRLKSVRQYLIMTQLQVAEATNLPVITISKIEHDKAVNSDSFIQLLLFYSNYISMNFLLAKDFNLADADRYTKSFSLNTVVKAKMEMIREEIDRDLSNIKKNYLQKLSDTIDLL
ncbi:helix-turn-helix domain-containing protein [Segatella buccae]|nr:helix-turn-helix transcriptional regulator [Segatella buccae]